MNKLILLLGLMPLTMWSFAQESSPETTNKIYSVVDSSNARELVLIQGFEVNAPVKLVWDTYTTKKGWENAFVPLAEVDLKVNGTIRTNYNASGEIGDSTTNILHILNYVPLKLLTLQAEISKSFPEFMKADEKDFYNVILFESIDQQTTKVTSYGIGYKNNEKYMSLMKYFIEANESSLLKLVNYLETGKPVQH